MSWLNLIIQHLNNNLNIDVTLACLAVELKQPLLANVELNCRICSPDPGFSVLTHKLCFSLSSFYTISNQEISPRWPKYRPISIDLKFLRVWAEWVAENSSSLSEDSKSDSEAGKFLPNYGAGWHGRAASRIMLVVRDERLSCGLSLWPLTFPRNCQAAE